MTDAHGGDSTTIKLTEIPMSQPRRGHHRPHRRSDRRAALLSGRAGRSKIRVIVTPRAHSNALHAIHLVHVGRFRGQTSDTVEHFMRAMREASTYVNGHHAETADLVAKFMKLDRCRQ